MRKPNSFRCFSPRVSPRLRVSAVSIIVLCSGCGYVGDPLPPPDKPAEVVPTPTANGVRLTWRARGANFRVFRKTEGADYTLLANVQEPEWLDANSEFGTRYAYLVQTIVKLPNGKEAESELSDEKVVTHIDKFPRTVPSG